MRVESNNFSTYLFLNFFVHKKTLITLQVNLKEHIQIIFKIHVMTPLILV